MASRFVTARGAYQELQMSHFLTHTRASAHADAHTHTHTHTHAHTPSLSLSVFTPDLANFYVFFILIQILFSQFSGV